MPPLADYEALVGSSTITELRALARRLAGKRVLIISSTRVGGGVAEILHRMVPLFQELGVDVRWDVIEGNLSFFKVTKKLHNALHGQRATIRQEMFELFLQVGRANMHKMALDREIIFVHDPQPITLVEARGRHPASRWIWRCHIDLSQPKQRVWEFLRPFILKFDAAVYSHPAFVQQLPMRQVLIAPSIDPLSDKNRELPMEEIRAILSRLEIPQDLPIVSQISRFDRLKDPVGVIEAFRRVRRSVR